MITAGEVLKNKRESLGKDLDAVSVDTKIQKRFLEYIEENQYDNFDSDVFATGFIKIYSKYLGLDVEKMLAIYRRSNPKNGKPQKKESPFLPKKSNGPKLRITPQILAITTILVFVFSVVGYIGYQIYKFQTPPQLEIISPSNEYTSLEDKVLVKGSTDSFATVEINDIPVQKDSNGYFESEVNLNEGINTISIKAKKNSNAQLETSKTLKVLFNPGNSIITEVEENEGKDFKLVLKINLSSSWIKLDVDSENKISQVLDPGTEREFTFYNKFTLVTGRVQSTEVKVNGENIQITSTQNSGVGQITCEIVDAKAECK
jgi:cytoskeletal protein RodZ